MMYAVPIFPIRATYPAHLIHLDMTQRTCYRLLREHERNWSLRICYCVTSFKDLNKCVAFVSLNTIKCRSVCATTGQRDRQTLKGTLFKFVHILSFFPAERQSIQIFVLGHLYRIVQESGKETRQRFSRV